MSQESNSRLVVIGPADVTLKISDVVEKIISGVLGGGTVDVFGVGEGIFLACSAMNMAAEIANVYINDLCIDTLGGGKPAVAAHLAQTQNWDYAKLANEEDKEMPDAAEQTVSVSRGAPIERLLTISLLRLAKFSEIRIVAAGGSINDAISLALQLTKGGIAKGDIGVELLHLYSIEMRNDPTKSIAAMSIYLQKGKETQYTERQKKLLQKLDSIHQ